MIYYADYEGTYSGIVGSGANATRLRWLFVFTFLLFSCVPAISQTIRFERISPEQGLSSAQVFCIMQDRYGFLWVGTEDGLNRYDGYEFVVYRNDRSDSASISGNHIFELFEDARGRLWVGTWGAGLNLYDPSTNTFRPYRHDPGDSTSLSHDMVSGLTQDAAGTIWISTWGGGLNRYDSQSDSFVRYKHEPGNPRSLSTNVLYRIRADARGRIWIGTFLEGLNVLEPATGMIRKLKPSSNQWPRNSNNVTRTFEDRNGDVWVGTWGGGLFKLDTVSWSFTAYRNDPRDPSSISGNVIHAIFEDREGMLWIGTGSNGISRLDRERRSFTHLKSSATDPLSLSSNSNILAIIQDRGGVIWAGTGFGLSKFSSSRYKFARLVDRAGLDNNVPWGMTGDSHGFLWIGTSGGGLYVVNTQTGKGAWRRLAEPRPGPRPVYAVTEDRHGNIWAGTEGGGLFRIQSTDRTVVQYVNDPSNPNSPSNNFVRDILRDRQGFLWIGYFQGGLSRLDPRSGVFVHYRHDPGDSTSLGSNNVESIYEDGDGFLWIGTNNRGLNRFDPEQGVFYRYGGNTNNVSHPHIRTIHEDKEGIFWIGTVGGGLNRLDPTTGRFQTFDEHDGLPNNSVYGILEDGQGNLWISTNNGLCRFTPSTGAFKSFNASDGLQSNEFNYNSYWRSPSGHLYFGGVGGVSVFHPDSIRENHFVPPVVLTSFRVFDKPYAGGGTSHLLREVVLSYDQNFFSFEFASLDFSNPQKNQYRFKLEGVDEDWHSAGTRRYGNYTHLDPGNHLLRVRGSNSDGIWNEAGVDLAILITPPFWATWWFRSGAFFLFAGLIFVGYRYRVARLLEIERLRLRIASDLHDEIGSSLGGIALESQLLQKRLISSDDVKTRLARINTIAHKTSDAIRDIVWLINPEHDTLGTLVVKMRDVANQLLGSVKFTFEGPADGTDHPLDLELKRHVFLIYKETIHNIARHAEATEVSIKVKAGRESIEVIIRDNGKGFDVDSVQKGNGLRNIRDRAAKIGAALALSSGPGSGTTIEIRAKL